ncbi:RNA polymerase sigma factor [Desulfococcaceae bacterium HSG9]|nr:RNA polymerase sigma factor [Desulfococcaceae bacterium HSG9]
MMTPKSESRKEQDKDSNLIKAINAGRSDLFHLLVKRYQHKLYNFGLRMCGNKHDAEDMVQDTFLNVFRFLNNFRHESKFKNWLYKVAASACLQRKRVSKYAPEPEKELSWEALTGVIDMNKLAETPRWASQPLENVLNAELSDHIKAAILALPEKYRVVIVLRDIEGFSTAEAAKILGLSQTNVKVRLHRARLFLKENLEDYFNHVTSKAPSPK